MRAKYVYEKKTGYTVIDFYKVKDKADFRYNIIKELIGTAALIVQIETTMLDRKIVAIDYVKDLEGVLKDNYIPYRILAAEKRDKTCLGIKVGKEKNKQFNVYIALKSDNFTREFFDVFFANNDYFMGIGPKKSLEEMVDEVAKGYIDQIFESEDFAFSLYDSSLMNRMRITKRVDA